MLSGMFRFAVDREIVDFSPCTIRGKDLPGTERVRERHLTLDEIPTFWRGLDNSEASTSVRIALRLLLVTAQRRSEVTGIRLVAVG